MIILLHGALGAEQQLEPLRLALPYSSIYTMNFEGHGNSTSNTRPFRIEHFAENLETFIEATAQSPVYIVGYSMGGYVALWLAAHKPELIEKIITLGTKFDWSAKSAEKEIQYLQPNRIKEKLPAYAEALERRHVGIGWENVLSKTSEMMINLGNTPRLTHEILEQVRCPVRLGVGDTDSMVSFKETTLTATMLSGADNGKGAGVYVLPNTRHPIEQVRYQLWSSIIQDFFKNTS